MFLGKIRKTKSANSPYIDDSALTQTKDEKSKNASIAAQEERDYSKPYPKFTRQYKKKYTQKEWNRFKPAQQEILTSRYTVELTDHETRNQKIKRHAKKVNLKNFDKGMKKFGDAQDTFWHEWDKGFKDAGMKKSGSGMDKIYGKKSNKSKALKW